MKRWVGHVAGLREIRRAYKILVRKLKGRFYSEGRTTLKCIIAK
jgi:hypothetical protein